MINSRVADAVRQRRTPILRGMVRSQKSPLRVLREDLHRRALIALNSVRYFFRIARGDFRDLNRAPILSKRAFSLIRRTEDQPPCGHLVTEPGGRVEISGRNVP